MKTEPEILELEARLEALQAERARLEERLGAVERERQTFLERYLEVEEENHHLANLYVASSRLHETLDVAQALGTVVEVLANLIGAARFAVHLLDENTQRLEPVARHGMEPSDLDAPQLGEGPIGRAVEAGKVAFADSAEDGPLVTIPLCSGPHAVGAIALHAWLPHKQGLSQLDRALFGLLGRQAALAIRAAQLAEAAAREPKAG